jgi:hypothetical protein
MRPRNVARLREMFMATYYESERYNRFIKAVTTPCPYMHVVTPDQVKIASGEHLDIWPASIADDQSD